MSIPFSFSVSPYCGRFAPTPSGPLHFGSLVAALGSYLDARAHRGQWLIRIEDIDRQRSREEYSTAILNSLTAHGMTSDHPVRYQSQHLETYQQALHFLPPAMSYPCDCSRKYWQKTAREGQLGLIYPRFCTDKNAKKYAFTRENRDEAIRLKLPNQTLCFNDRLLGRCCYDLQNEIGDPILRRRDGDFAYALAVVVDDALQGVTDVVRGADLLATTVIQQVLQQALALPVPQYLHLPLVLGERSEKLSKQNHAPAIDDHQPGANLLNALRFLGQNTEGLFPFDSTSRILQTATRRWDLSLIPKENRCL